MGYTIVNIIFGTGSVIIAESRAGFLSNGTTLNMSEHAGQIAELYYTTLIYDFTKEYGGSEVKSWTVLLYFLFLISGLINMVRTVIEKRYINFNIF